MGSECTENMVTTTLSLIVHQERYTTEQFTVEFVTAKQARYSTTKCTNVESWSQTISVHHHMVYCCCIWGCNTCMVQYQPVGICYFCLCKTVHFWTVNAVRIWPQLPESRIPSNKIQNRTVYSWVLCCKTSTVQYQIMKQLSSCLHNNFSRAPHGLQFLHLVVQNTHGRVPTVWQLFSCKSVRFCAVNALRICTQLPESLCPSSKIQNWTVYI